MSRCVCTHIKALHFDGVCGAVINPCGCTKFETPVQADLPSGYTRTSSDNYSGFYANKRWSA